MLEAAEREGKACVFSGFLSSLIGEYQGKSRFKVIAVSTESLARPGAERVGGCSVWLQGQRRAGTVASPSHAGRHTRTHSTQRAPHRRAQVEPRYTYMLIQAARTTRRSVSSPLVPTAMEPHSPAHPGTHPTSSSPPHSCTDWGTHHCRGIFRPCTQYHLDFFFFFQPPFTLCNMPNLTELWLFPSMQTPLKYTYIHASKYTCMYIKTSFCLAQQTDLAPCRVTQSLDLTQGKTQA